MAPSPPDAFEGELTIRGALALPVISAGAPEVVAGAAHLDRPVRWVHVAEAPDIATALRGGELLLSEGRLFSGHEAEDRRRVNELAERRIAGLFIELGTTTPRIPLHLREACETHGVVLVALHVPVAFIDVTEAVHQHLSDVRLRVLDTTQQVQDTMADAVLDGATIPDLIEIVSRFVANPVFYERALGGMQSQAAAGLSRQAVQAAWDAYVHRLVDAPTAIEAPLAAEGRDLGRLVALAANRPFSRADTVAVERAARLASLVLMRDRHQDSIAARSQRKFLTKLLDGDIAPYVAEPRAAALGFSSPVLLPLTVRLSRHHRARPVTIEDRLWRQVWEQVAVEAANRHMPLLVDQGTSRETTLVLVGADDAAHRREVVDRFAAWVHNAAQRQVGQEDSAVICAGPAVHTWQAVAEGLGSCLDAMDGALHSPPRAWHDATDLDLDRLLWSLRNNPDLERFARLRLEKLVEHDRRRRTKLMQTLQVLLEQNGRKAEAARALHLERQSLYNRVDRIQTLLGVDLDDAEVRLSLHLAIRILQHRLGSELS